MRINRLALFLTVMGAGCASGGPDVIRVPGRSPDVIVVDDEDRRDRDGRDRDQDSRVARGLNVPKGHYPPPGECRIWHPSRPPGQQPPPARCDRLVGRVPFGAFVLYNAKEWDTRHDWRNEARRRPGSVPDVMLRIMNSLQRN